MALMRIRDPIHGFIEYSELEEKIINTVAFQRLRDIKQLALAHYVYPGALHTRFDHSLGVMHLSGKIAQSLMPKPKSKKADDYVKIVRLAGLLHDIGHGPFSHVSEQILDENTDKDKLEGLLTKYEADNAHELMSILIIYYGDEFNSILGESKAEIINLIKKTQSGFLEKDIVSGPLDADKLDYLLRDAYFAGVKYGIFDIDKIIESMTPVIISSTKKRVGITEEGIYALEQFLLANYHMKMQVYHHRIRRIADAMLIKGIKLAIREGADEIRKIFSIEDSKEYVDDYINYSDHSLIDKMLQIQTNSLVFFERLKNRNLLKEAFALDLSKLSPITYQKINDMPDSDLEKISMDFLSGKCKLSINPNLIIVDKQSFRNPTFRKPGIFIDANTIYVLCEKDSRMPKSFRDISGIFSNPSIEPEKTMLYIYAPIDGVNRDKKDKICEDLEKHINKVLNVL